MLKKISRDELVSFEIQSRKIRETTDIQILKQRLTGKTSVPVVFEVGYEFNRSAWVDLEEALCGLPNVVEACYAPGFSNKVVLFIDTDSFFILHILNYVTSSLLARTTLFKILHTLNDIKDYSAEEVENYITTIKLLRDLKRESD